MHSVTIFRRLRSIAATSTLAVAFLLGTGGCVTQSQVKSIVTESNAAMLASQIADVEIRPDGTSSTANAADWKTASRKIEAFIAANPDQTTAISALRVRQGVLLIANGQYNLAQAAFNAATDPRTDRDKALKNLSPSLIWWYQHSASPTLNEIQRNRAREALAAFDGEITRVQGSTDTRDFLAEMRARIGLKLASEEQGDAKRSTFVDSVNRYSAIFTPDDVNALAQGELRTDSFAVTVTERRRLRAPGVIAEANRISRSGSLSALTAADFSNQQFAALVLKR